MIPSNPTSNDLPAGWSVSPLEDVADILDGKRVPINAKERETRIGQVPYYGATGQVGWIDDFLFDEELVLLGEDGAPFLDASKPKAYVIRGKSWVNNHAHVLRAKDGTPNAYLKYFLDRFDYHGFVTGTTRLKLTQGAMRQIPVALAPPEDRKRIVAEIEKQFSRLDEAVDSLKRIKANLKRYKAAVLKAAVEGKLTEGWRRKHPDIEPASKLLERILAERRAKWAGKGTYQEPSSPDISVLPTLPHGWTWASLDQLLREPLRNGHSAKASGNRQGLRAFTLSAVTEGDFSEKNTKLTVAHSDKVADLWAEPGDIYVERSNTPELVGLARLYKGPSKFAFIPDLLIRVRLIRVVSPRFVEVCLLSEDCRRYFRSRAQGISGSMPKIDQTVIEQTRIPLPPLEEQKEIVAEVERRVSVIDELETTVEANLTRADRLRQSILSQAFSGRLYC